ncbi:ArsR/SmtB family transcription factor [Tumebacillus lipolyticus]|uniref:ArsR/SmtB family transcription factor n=1 Tax=Tumebacillus lipolyticus TaxID=1280370 RepID=A0ABW4ZYB7_9BACL
MDASAPKYDVFQAIADPTRRTMLKMLGEKELSVTQICGHFPITRTAVSKHLHILTDAGLVRHHKAGRETRYQLQPEKLLELRKWLNYFEQYWENKLAMLKHFVEQEDGSDSAGQELRLIDQEPKRDR